MQPDQLKRYNELRKAADSIRPPANLPEFWMVEEDSARLKEPSYMLTNGELSQPEKDHQVQPGFPFEPEGTEFRDGRRETFAEWLVAPENPLFAPQACGIGDRLRAVYVLAARPIVVRSLRPEMEYRLTVFDPVTGRRSRRRGIHTDRSGVWHGSPPPHGHDYVVLLEVQ